MHSYDSNSYSYTPPTQDKTPSFMGLSAIIHGVLFAAVSLFAVHNALQMKPEGSDTVVIEFEPTLGSQTEFKEVALEPLAETTKTTPDESTIAVKPLPKKVAKAKAKPAPPTPRVPKLMPTIAKVKAAAPPPMIEESDMISPLEDETPAPEITQLSDAEIANELDQVTSEMANAEAKALAKAEKEDMEKRLQEEQSEAIAAAEAAAARQAAEDKRQALAAARADAARKAGIAALAASQVNRKGAIGKTNQAFGVKNGIRQIGDLKQSAGNLRPTYDVEDRRLQRQGQITILAYVTRDGGLTNFKMTASSGHPTLDQKTMNAIRRWRFMAGQEGWVEIPFNWSLKGDAQEMPSTLRRSLSQR